jgi:hypothetical protein
MKTLSAFACAAFVAGFAPASAQVQPPTPAAPPGMAPPLRRVAPPRESLASLLVVETAPRAQMERLKRIRRRPASDAAAIAAWIAANRDKLPAPYLFELARRTFDADRAAATAWFALGAIRARYAAVRCTDRTARGYVRYLPVMAAVVARHASANRAAWGAAGLRALATEPLFPDAPSPAWLCLSGVRAARMRRSGVPIKPEDFIAPRADWPRLQKQVRAEQTRYFTEQGKPQDDPVPPSARHYAVHAFDGGYRYRRFAWLDGDRLLFDREKRGDRDSRTLMSWSPEGGLKTVEKIGSAFDSQWCAGGGFLFRTLGRAKGKAFKQTYRYGPFGQGVERTIAPGTPVELARLTASNAKRYRGVAAIQQSPFDCRLVERKALKVEGKRSRWLPLRKGDGFLVFREAKPNRQGTEETTVVYRPTRTGPARTLLAWPFIQKTCVRYHAFRQAYFIQPCALGRGSMKRYVAARKLNCVPVWWFRPGDGAKGGPKEPTVTRDCAPADSVIDNPALYAPSKAGLIRFTYQRNTYHGRKPGGIYLTGPDGKTARIRAGFIQSGAVSPGGCHFAFREIAPVKGRWRGVLRVVTVC